MNHPCVSSYIATFAVIFESWEKKNQTCFWRLQQQKEPFFTSFSSLCSSDRLLIRCIASMLYLLGEYKCAIVFMSWRMSNSLSVLWFTFFFLVRSYDSIVYLKIISYLKSTVWMIWVLYIRFQGLVVEKKRCLTLTGLLAESFSFSFPFKPSIRRSKTTKNSMGLLIYEYTYNKVDSFEQYCMLMGL